MFGFGYYTMALEAMVEVTYPVVQSMSAAALVVTGYIFAAISIAMSTILQHDLTAEAASLQVAL